MLIYTSGVANPTNLFYNVCKFKISKKKCPRMSQILDSVLGKDLDNHCLEVSSFLKARFYMTHFCGLGTLKKVL